ncbi:hypothetical protein, partial [Actinocorallia lasiicapitis]
ARVKERADRALAAQLKVHEARCAGTEDALDMLFRPSAEAHDCDECRARARVPLELLMTVPPVVFPPVGLKHRVVHTGTDPELAGYRADISGKGGRLTPEGLPRQLDVPSPMSRRWMFAGSGMAGALAAALIASFMIGNGSLLYPDLTFPPLERKPSTERAPRTQNPAAAPAPKQPGPDAPRAYAGPTPSLQVTDLDEPPVPQGTPSPSPTVPGPAPSASPSGSVTPFATTEPSPTAPSEPPPPPPLAELDISGTEVQIGGGRVSQVQLSAQHGPVDWRAVSDTDALTLDQDAGRVAPGEPFTLVVRLRPALIRVAGSGIITIINSASGESEQVTVSWPISLL